MEILRLPVLSDNYIFVLHDPQRRIAAVVDPALAAPVLDCLAQVGATLVAIFITHHHWDHVGGNLALQEQFPAAVIYGGLADRGRIPGQQVFLAGGDRVGLGDRAADVFFVPGHTRGHIAYYFPPVQTGQLGELFCGDTIFGGGCGRLKEGTPAQMMASLEQLRALPDNTRVWCAHEYTLGNLRFALTVDQDNPALQQRFREVQMMRDRSEATIPSLLGVEKQTNPFLRWDDPAIQSRIQTQKQVQTFARLRGMKDMF
jgi:hydroxyacylglutathione hydrolase